MLRGWGGELLLRDAAVASVASKRKRKKRLIRLQVQTYRHNYACKEKPVGEYLQVLALQTFSHSGTTSATATWYTLAGIPVGLYLPVFTCGEKAYIAMQKEETWIRQFNMRLGD